MKIGKLNPRTKGVSTRFPSAPIPMEWVGGGSWRLPSGKALAEFALQAGFLAPLMFGTGGFPKNRQGKPLPGEQELETGISDGIQRRGQIRVRVGK